MSARVVDSWYVQYTWFMFNPEYVDTVKKWLGAGSINLFGLPFAGKDSQGHRLAALLDGSLIGGGQILRESVIPDYVQADLDAGKLAPTEDYMRIVLPFLSKSDFANRPLILSAVGRWHGEEDGVVQSLSVAGHALKAVVLIKISEDEARRRWLEHENQKDRGDRSDDSEVVLDNRFSEFHNKTGPVLDYYKQRNLLIEVNGQQSRDDVTRDIVAELVNRVSASQ